MEKFNYDTLEVAGVDVRFAQNGRPSDIGSLDAALFVTHTVQWDLKLTIGSTYSVINQ